VNKRLRRLLLAFTAATFAMSANSIGVQAGGDPGGCGVCMDFTLCMELIDYYTENNCTPSDPFCEPPNEDPCGTACNEWATECDEFSQQCMTPSGPTTYLTCGIVIED